MGRLTKLKVDRTHKPGRYGDGEGITLHAGVGILPTSCLTTPSPCIWRRCPMPTFRIPGGTAFA